MTRPRTSIIMPTYNRAHIIRTAIDSVLAQTDPDWELVVVDDGSTDETKQVVEGIGDQRIRYTRQKNAGAAAARNHGLELARGEWVAYLDSDNELEPRYLEVMHAHIGEYPDAVFAVPRSRRILEQYKDGKLVKKLADKIDIVTDEVTIHDIFMRTFHLDTTGLIHHRKVFEAGIEWDTELPVMEDWELALSIGNAFPDGFVFVNEVLCTYYQRFGGDGVRSNSSYADSLRAFELIYQKHRDDPLMQGQTWHEAMTKRWRGLQQDFEAGKLPPYSEFYFMNVH